MARVAHATLSVLFLLSRANEIRSQHRKLSLDLIRSNPFVKDCLVIHFSSLVVSVHVHPQGVSGFRQGATFLTEVRDPADVASLDVVSQVLTFAETFSGRGFATCLQRGSFYKSEKRRR